jgi:hypothetical protein
MYCTKTYRLRVLFACHVIAWYTFGFLKYGQWSRLLTPSRFMSKLKKQNAKRERKHGNFPKFKTITPDHAQEVILDHAPLLEKIRLVNLDDSKLDHSHFRLLFVFVYKNSKTSQLATDIPHSTPNLTYLHCWFYCR